MGDSVGDCACMCVSQFSYASLGVGPGRVDVQHVQRDARIWGVSIPMSRAVSRVLSLAPTCPSCRDRLRQIMGAALQPAPNMSAKAPLGLIMGESVFITPRLHVRLRSQPRGQIMGVCAQVLCHCLGPRCGQVVGDHAERCHPWPEVFMSTSISSYGPLPTCWLSWLITGVGRTVSVLVGLVR